MPNNKKNRNVKNKEKNDEKKVLPGLPINWEITTYGKLPTNTYK